FGVHGVGGIIGIFATGLFASKLINPAGADGLFSGSYHLLLVQMLVIMVTAVYSFLMSYIILKALDLTIGVRVEDESEMMGLDISQHGESGYTM
ncbi:MAG: ammonia channel protein, partial [Nitrospiraceae bacterium]|nr:ammonia channel protein [Nitrospiraceae bacterium]